MNRSIIALTGTLYVLLSSLAFAAMGPLLAHTQALQQPGGLCLDSPVRCVNSGPQPSAAACAAACDAAAWCSSMTWAGPENNCCQQDCYLRFDGLFEAAACAACDQTTANKSSGWIPGGPPSPSPPPPPPPSCATNGTACPPPQWEAEWNLTRSTIVQPWCTDAFTRAHPWGLISLAWDCSADGFEEAATLRNCTALKAAGIASRCLMYHNQELALRWLESQRAALDDPARLDWFLRWPNGTLYTEPERDRPHAGFEAQGFWDFRNPSASAYFVSSVLAAVASPAVDGSYADDVSGVPAEHPDVINRTGLSPSDVAALQYATQATNAALITALVRAKKYLWQAFGAGDGVKPGPARDASACAAWMRAHCAPAAQDAPLLMAFDVDNKNQSLAAFLVVRPPNGYIGFGWYSNDANWDPLFLLQAGAPLGTCTEAPAGVFSRQWTLGTASLDCNSWSASLPFASL